MESREVGSRALLFAATVITAVVIVRAIDHTYAASSSEGKPSDPDYVEGGIIHIRPPKATLLEVEVVGTFETAEATGNLSAVLLPGPGSDNWKVWISETVSKQIDAGGSRIDFRASGDTGARTTTATFYPQQDSTADSTTITIPPDLYEGSPRPYHVTWEKTMDDYYNLHVQVEEFDLDLLLQNSL